jgi:hypothetical protein
VGVAEKFCMVPAGFDTDVGVIDTEARVGTEVVMLIGKGPACFVIPLKVAFTKRLRLPALPPAVNTTGFPMEEFRAPRPLVNIQE